MPEFDPMHQRPQRIVEHAQSRDPFDRPDPFTMAMWTRIGRTHQRISTATTSGDAGQAIEIGEAAGAKGWGIAGGSAKIADERVAEVGEALHDEGERHHGGLIIADGGLVTKFEWR